MGYGWRDEHVNLLVDEMLALQPDLTAAVVGFRSGTEVGKITPQNTYLRKLGRVAWRMMDCFAYCPVDEAPFKTRWQDGSFMLFPCGFMLSESDEAALLNHFA